MAEVPAVLAFELTDVGLATIEKSWTVKVADAECERLLLVPVTATV
jgi:hypothetical protein